MSLPSRDYQDEDEDKKTKLLVVGRRLNKWGNFGVSYRRVPNLYLLSKNLKKSLPARHQAHRLSTGEKYILALCLSEKTILQGL